VPKPKGILKLYLSCGISTAVVLQAGSLLKFCVNFSFIITQPRLQFFVNLLNVITIKLLSEVTGHVLEVWDLFPVGVTNCYFRSQVENE
jgi:hypothetical protein